MSIELKWLRPSSVAFPSFWHRFQARDSVTDNLVEYRVQDLPEDRYEEAIQFMTENYMPNEPLCKSRGGNSDEVFVKDFQRAWRAAIKQRVPLVCFKEGSEEIVGVNVNMVRGRTDTFGPQVRAVVSLIMPFKK